MSLILPGCGPYTVVPARSHALVSKSKGAGELVFGTVWFSLIITWQRSLSLASILIKNEGTLGGGW